jgi:glycosyltransferase involved in cell wall biosynthesis
MLSTYRRERALNHQSRVAVVVCTRNPNREMISKTIAALNVQSLERNRWEVVVVDNGSTVPVSESGDWSKLPRVRHLIEQEPGLTNARIAGLRATDADIVTFVDDDNWLDADYLEVAMEIGDERPWLGTWGGQLLPVWEVEPEHWTVEYWNWLAIRALARDLWSNSIAHHDTHPYGAGMCVRRSVFEEYVTQVIGDTRRRTLDRTGNNLLGGGDADLNYTACEMGLATGVFCRLKARHYMPAFRVSEVYLLRLVEDMTCSSVIVRHLWRQPTFMPSRAQRLFDWYRNLHISPRMRRFARARARGLQKGLRAIESWSLQKETL